MPRKPVRLFPHPDRRDGIPVDGELFEADDVARLVGNGSAVRKDPRKAGPAAKVKRPDRPAREG